MMLEVITALGPAIVAGLFGVIMWQLDHQEKARKANSEKQNDMLSSIKANTEKLTQHDELITTLSDIAKRLKESTETNGEGVKVLMRYMLQRYHATYVMRGFISSHEKQEFLEAYEVYHAKGGNGTGESWMREVDALPIRDDIPVVNPYIELYQKGGKE